MGKILNTTYHDTVEKVSGFYENLVNNPFYIYNDKKPTLCTYYNINKDYSSTDPGSGLIMDNIGSESPVRYNKIEDFILYGFTRIELNNNVDEFGVESDKIEGECYVLPNTIIPTENDYFEVQHIKDSSWLFIVKDVQKDTLDNGSNVYKLSYKLEYIDNSEIKDKVVYNFKMIEEREGTNIAKVVRCEDYEIAKIMDEKAVMLKRYFQELFYNDKVQTFTYMDLTEFRTYDPYMIEFLIRNKILDDSEDSFIYVTHQLQVPKTFCLDYDKTFFRVFEKKNKDKLLSSNYSTYLKMISSYGTTFSARYEDYYWTEYDNDVKPGYNSSCIKEELLYDIIDKNLKTEPKNIWQNILIKYFNNEELIEDEVNSIDDIEYTNSKDAFYLIPLLIFCLEKYIESALK